AQPICVGLGRRTSPEPEYRRVASPRSPFTPYLSSMPANYRRSTPTAWIGDVAVGSCHPVVVQSMTNTDTADVAATVRQVAALTRAGSELVRVTVNNEE